jgi:hypothetical protein
VEGFVAGCARWVAPIQMVIGRGQFYCVVITAVLGVWLVLGINEATGAGYKERGDGAYIAYLIHANPALGFRF